MKNFSVFILIMFGPLILESSAQSNSPSKKTVGASNLKPLGRPVSPVINSPGTDNTNVIYEFDHLPTFADHSEEGKRMEATLPAALPVIPLFSFSADLPGYVDISRRMSFIMIDGLVEEVPPYYSDGDDMLQFYAYKRKEHSAPAESDIQYVEMKKRDYADQNATGYQHTMRYIYENEWWVRNELQIGRYEQDPLGYHLITIISFYPAAYGQKAADEVNYYFDNLIVNRYE
jgi:hypothetical protein